MKGRVLRCQNQRYFDQDVVSEGHNLFEGVLSGKPADLLDDTNSDWLRTSHLGHSNKLEPSKRVEERWKKRKERMANGASMQIWSSKTFFTLGATSTTECELNMPKPIRELDGIATERDITSASIN